MCVVWKIKHWVALDSRKQTQFAWLCSYFGWFFICRSLRIWQMFSKSSQSLAKVLSIPIKHEKTVLPTTTHTFVGIEIDSILMEKRLPIDKLQKLELYYQHFKTGRKLLSKNFNRWLAFWTFCLFRSFSTENFFETIKVSNVQILRNV